MGKLFARIRRLVKEGRYVVGLHAAERLDERRMLEWQVVVGLEGGELQRERRDAKPNPAIEVREQLPDGTEVTAVWSLLPDSGVAKLVTVYFADEWEYANTRATSESNSLGSD